MEGMKGAVSEVTAMIKEGQLTQYQARIALFDTCCEYGARTVRDYIASEFPEVHNWLNPPAFEAFLSQFPGYEEEPEVEEDILLLPNGHFDFLNSAF